MTSTPRVVIYARQSEEEDDGIEQQLADCTEEARRRGWPILAQYVDNDVSGSYERGEKTDWFKMLQSYDRGEFDVMIVNESDRVTRRLEDVLEIRHKRKIRLIIPRGGIDTDDPAGDYMFKQFVLLAEREVAQKTERARRYARERRKKGHPTAGRVPYGYRWVYKPDRDERGTRWAVVEEEKKVVQRIFSEYLGKPKDQRSFKQIARDLNEDGYRTRTGHRWGATTVRRILVNPNYAAMLAPAQPTGEFRIENIVLEECLPGAWEPLVSREQLEAARNLILSTKPNHDGDTSRKWLMPGLATCGGCGGPIRSAVAKNRPKARHGDNTPAESYHAYRCATIGKGCFQRAGDIIDEYIKELCIARLSRDDAADLFEPDDDEDITVLYARREQLENGYEQIYSDAVERGRFDQAKPALDRLEAQQSEVNERIKAMLNKQPLAELAAVEDVRGWWDEATLSTRRAVVSLLMEPVIHPLGMGKRVTTLEQIVGTVTPGWRQPVAEEQ